MTKRPKRFESFLGSMDTWQRDGLERRRKIHLAEIIESLCFLVVLVSAHEEVDCRSAVVCLLRF